MCWGAIDGCHIPIKCPLQGGLKSCKEYHNFKNFYSIVLMAMVDSKYRFRWGSCGFPGNSHDSVILQSTNLWEQIQEKEYLPNISKTFDGIEVPLILADSAFQLKPWLMKSYTNTKLADKERYFNYQLSHARMVTECAYGQLKGRWSILMRKSESFLEEVKMTTLACVVLHNICISKGDTLPRTLDVTIDPNTNRRRESSENRDILHMMDPSRPRNCKKGASRVRDTLANSFWLEKQGISQGQSE